MKRWRLMMLGSMLAAPVAGEAVTLPAGAWPLIGFLITHPHHEASREAVVAALWPDQPSETARKTLATLLWRIKAAFGDANPLIGRGERLALRRAGSLWIDALALDHRARRAAAAARSPSSPQARARLRRDLLALAGDFLPDHDAEWALIERERLRCLRLDALFALAKAEAGAEQWPAVVDICRALCAAEPLREDAQRLLMLGYAQTGNRALAIRQYARCAAMLAQELGIEPMPETRALHDRLANGDRADAPPPPAAGDASGGHPLPEGVAGVRQALLAARDTMATAITLIETMLLVP
ncbi:MAG: hypothetical protein K2X76_11285 [Sphingomonas sp.]|nr:hypothetical protein [Sphingomonas sp.]